MTTPDSGEREVLKREADSMRVVEIPLPLAQRILAALEGNGNAALRKALAVELRAVIPK